MHTGQREPLRERPRRVGADARVVDQHADAISADRTVWVAGGARRRASRTRSEPSASPRWTEHRRLDRLRIHQAHQDDVGDAGRIGGTVQRPGPALDQGAIFDRVRFQTWTS
jgi:hypothetical protein